MRQARYPRHFVPAVDAYDTALALGMGWGMVPEPVLVRSGGALREVVPDRPVDVMLYWQHWAREPLAAQRLTQAIEQAARNGLLQPDGAASHAPAQV